MTDLFRWRRSPAGSHVVHAGRFFEMKTICGATIGPLGSGWQALPHEVEIECGRCLRVLDGERVRPSSVTIDARGARTVRA